MKIAQLKKDLFLDYQSTTSTVFKETAQVFKPPNRMTVSKSCEENMYISSGGYNGLWSSKITPYMIEPMNKIPSRMVSVVIFAGCARSGKTNALVDGGITYGICNDTADMLVVHITESTGRRFAKMRVNRMIQNSPNIKANLSTNRNDDNILTKQFKNGTTLQIAYPSPSQLAAAEFKYVLMTDVDRYDDDAGGEGSIFEQAKKRTQTYLSAGTTVAESSPGRDFTDISWTPKTKHEAPPVNGILGLYNTGDRRLWCWSCPHCGEEIIHRPGTELFNLPKREDLIPMIAEHGADALAEKFNMIFCPSCGGGIEHELKYELNSTGYWKPENENYNRVASYWLSGVCASFQTWLSLLENYFKALLHLEKTGEEGKLKATLNVDWGVPYIPLAAENVLSARDLEQRAEDIDEKVCYQGVRYLIATVDVQKRRFVVQVQGFGVGNESWIVDRFNIRNSARKDGDGFKPVDPVSHLEDWDLLIDQVMNKRYRLETGGGSMGIVMTACDSAGSDGVTENAYKFWKSLKDKRQHKKFNLVKGVRTRTAHYICNKTYPDKSSRAARRAAVTNVIPLWLLNTTYLKDSVTSNLKRKEPGPDYVHFPSWLPSTFYDELTAEYRDEKGWNKIKTNYRNETFDLMCYAKAVQRILLDGTWKNSINWEAPPPWANKWETNINVTFDEEKEPENKPKRRGRRVRGRFRRN